MTIALTPGLAVIGLFVVGFSMGARKRCPAEQLERAGRVVLDHLDNYRSIHAACRAIGSKFRVGTESLHVWVSCVSG